MVTTVHTFSVIFYTHQSALCFCTEVLETISLEKVGWASVALDSKENWVRLMLWAPHRSIIWPNKLLMSQGKSKVVSHNPLYWSVCCQ